MIKVSALYGVEQLINAAEGEGDEAATLEGLAGAFASFTQDGAEVVPCASVR